MSHEMHVNRHSELPLVHELMFCVELLYTKEFANRLLGKICMKGFVGFQEWDSDSHSYSLLKVLMRYYDIDLRDEIRGEDLRNIYEVAPEDMISVNVLPGFALGLSTVEHAIDVVHIIFGSQFGVLMETALNRIELFDRPGWFAAFFRILASFADLGDSTWELVPHLMKCRVSDL